MQASMWTSYLIEMLPDEMAAAFAKHGWKTCEISDEHGHDLLKQGSPGKVGEAFRQVADGLGISFPQGHFYLCNKGIRPEDMIGRRQADIAPEDDTEYDAAFEDMKRWVDLFVALGVRAGVLHVGGNSLKRSGWSDERILERRVAAVRRIADYASGSPLIICLENLNLEMGFGTFAQVSQVIEAVARPNVGFCLDTGHAQICGVDIPAYIRSCGSRLFALHIADNLGTRDDHMLPFGKGVVPWPAVLEALGDVGYDGLFNFEVPGENRCPMPIRLAKLDYAYALAQQMMAMTGKVGTE